MPGNGAVVRAVYDAYAASDRQALEALVAPDFTFTSPFDNRIDRETYFARCWPNNQWIEHYDYIRIVPFGDQVVVTYELATTGGTRIRNTEILTVRDDQLIEAEVYFGWPVPHDAEPGGFLDKG